jgi:hypothetical protein
VSGGGRRRGGRFTTRPVDLAEVVDLRRDLHRRRDDDDDAGTSTTATTSTSHRYRHHIHGHIDNDKHYHDGDDNGGGGGGGTLKTAAAAATTVVETFTLEGHPGRVALTPRGCQIGLHGTYWLSSIECVLTQQQ